MRGPRLIVAGAILATLLAATILVAVSGDGDDEDDDATTSTTLNGAEGGSGGAGSGEDDGTGGRPQGGSESSDGGGSSGEGVQGGTSEGPPPSDAEAGFEAELRSIVGASLAELAPLAQGGAAASNPEQYAGLLGEGASQIEGTIEELENLDTPPDGEEGVEQVIDAYRGLHDAVSRGAKDFSTGNGSRIASALGYLGEAAGRFRVDLVTATQTLAAAGFAAPGIR